MKKLLLSLVGLSLVASVTAQKPRAKASQSMLRQSIERQAAIDETTNLQMTVNPYVSRSIPQNEEQIGSTVYDLQSNGSTPSNRIEYFNDGTIGTTWTTGTGPAAYADRGTGYNYFNGSAWGTSGPRVEPERTGWPAYTACGPTGECFISHISATEPSKFYKREVKGTGSWTSMPLPGPQASFAGLMWPRMTSSGPNNEYIHVLALTAPVANGGQAFEGQDGALIYYRSTDAGATWESPVVLDGMGADSYIGFGGDSYSLTAVGDNVAILVTDNWTDLFTMVSRDNGSTWEKTVIWEHPIPFWNNVPSIDTIYCPDGSGQATFDHNGKLHVAFGVNRGLFVEGDTAPSWFPFVDGLAYWNEDKPTWVGGDQANVLNPDLLWENGDLIGYMIDIDGNGQLDWIGTEIANIGLYYLSPTSMPQIIVDQYNGVYVVYTSITEGYDNGTQQYRHLWLTYSLDGGNTWNDQIHLSDNILHFLDECVFPSIARETGEYRDYIHVMYQADAEPGLSVRGDEDQPTDNMIYYLQITKPTVGVEEVTIIEKPLSVSEAYPNPFKNTSSVDITLAKSSEVSMEIFSVTGQKVSEKNLGIYPSGVSKLAVDASALKSGLYFVKVKAGENNTTVKVNVL